MWDWLTDMREVPWRDLTHWEVLWQGARRWPFLLLGGVLLVLLVVHLYRTQAGDLPRWRRWLMQGAKAAAFLLLLAIFLEPVLVAERTSTLKSTVAVLIDDSLSMGIRDRYLAPEARERVARSAAAGLLSDAQLPTRTDILKGLLLDPVLEPLKVLGQEFELQLFRFGDGLEKETPAGLAALEPAAHATDIGSALRRALEAFQGRSLSAILLLTDGQHNRGLDPVLAAEAARSRGVAVYTVGVGEPQARDIELTNVLAEDVVFADDVVPVYVKLRQTGFAGSVVEMVLRRDGIEVGRKAASLSDAAEQTVAMSFTPEMVGSHTYTVDVVAQPGELLTTNNSFQKTMRVIDQAIRVLYVEEEPRWYWRFLTAALLRDKRVKLSILLRSADPVLETDPAYVFDFPGTRRDVLDYDVVIFGDVNPDYFTDDQLRLLEEFVRVEGGALLMVAGRKFSPGAWQGTPVETMLPVEFESQSAIPTERMLTEAAGYAVELTSEGRASPVTQLAEDAETSALTWERLPELYWSARNVTRAKPAASVLAVHATAEGRSGPLPLVAAQQYGRGRTLFVGTDETWRWRQLGDDYFGRFWGQAIQYLSVVRLLGEARRVQFTTDRSRYSVGEVVNLSARVLDDVYQPLEAEHVVAEVRSEGPTPATVELRGSPERPGLFAGTFVPPEPGQYFVWVEGAEDSGKASFTVGPPRLEFVNPAMNRDLLQQIASASGGSFHYVDGLADLLVELKGRRRQVRQPVEDDLWDAPLVLVLVTLLLCTEWLVRKRSDLP